MERREKAHAHGPDGFVMGIAQNSVFSMVLYRFVLNSVFQQLTQSLPFLPL